MTRQVNRAIRLTLLVVPVAMAFVVPRLVDPWYQQCPSVNCFPVGVSPYLFLSVGLTVGLVLNVLMTRERTID